MLGISQFSLFLKYLFPIFKNLCLCVYVGGGACMCARVCMMFRKEGEDIYRETVADFLFLKIVF